MPYPTKPFILAFPLQLLSRRLRSCTSHHRSIRERIVEYWVPYQTLYSLLPVQFLSYRLWSCASHHRSIRERIVVYCYEPTHPPLHTCLFECMCYTHVYTHVIKYVIITKVTIDHSYRSTHLCTILPYNCFPITYTNQSVS